MKRNLIILSVLALMSFACSSTAQDQSSSNEAAAPASTAVANTGTPDYKVLAPADYKKALADENVVVIDVRTPQEYAGGHIDGAINVNVMDRNFSNLIQENAPKDKQVMIYCRSGNRSARASAIMKDLGYPTVYDLRGGYMAWQRQ